MEQLGTKGPWIVERLIGVQEFPRDMDCDAKATMLEGFQHGAAMGLIWTCR